MKTILGISIETFEEIRDLFEQTDIQDFSYEENKHIISIGRKKVETICATPSTNITTTPVPTAPVNDPVISQASMVDSFEDQDKYTKITSPIMGTFYTSSAPDMPDFVSVGSKIQAGSTVCIVEAMKIFNEIKAPISGTITAILKKKGDNVSVDDTLFVIEKS
ncbi:MAG: acetyl-CoA carboxylase biotin carboxyl carrier protein [Brevinema sp.]